MGVVYGDIGTSPLYALRESLAHSVKADVLTEEAVIGPISLLIFALIFTVTIKYVVFLMRADNRGEGGILSLMALAQSALGGGSAPVFLLGVAGAALFSGDAIITPAISVMSAIEGLELVTHRFSEFVLPITIFILVTLFWVQSHGTARVAAFFGPIMIAFFLCIAVLGAAHIPDAPQVLSAFDPRAGVSFLLQHGWLGFAVLGSVFLGVTGAEALYADMGHFGRFPIRFAWLAFVLPALLLNYLGQGALILSRPEAIDNPFFLLAPEWALLPLVILSTLATVIASQAVITGAFSIVRQAIQLGLVPRLEVTHTSASQEGQIYIGRINRLLLVGVLLLVIAFKSSSALASAYGIAGDGHHGGHDRARLRRGMEKMGLAVLGGAAADFGVSRRGPGVSYGEPDEGQGWRLGASRARRLRNDRHVDMDARHAASRRKNPSRLNTAQGVDCDVGEVKTDARAWHGNLSNERSGRCASRVIAQSSSTTRFCTSACW